MKIHHILMAAGLVSALIGTAQADGLKPIQGQSIELRGMSGNAYYTVEQDGFHLVATLASEDIEGTPIRIKTVLSSGQTVTFSTPGSVGTEPDVVEISRKSDQVIVNKGSRVD